MEGTLAAPNSASLVVVGRRVSPPARVSPESAPADARTLALTMHWTQRGWQTRVDQCEGPVWFKSCAISASHLATAAKNPPRQFPAWKLPPVWPSNCCPTPRRPKSARPRGGVPLAGAAYTPQCDPSSACGNTPCPSDPLPPRPQRPTATPPPATHRHPGPRDPPPPRPSDPPPPRPQRPTATLPPATHRAQRPHHPQ